MLSFMQNFFAAKGNPIGVDFGTDCLRLVQVQVVNEEYRLVAAASADVPGHVRADAPQRMGWFVEAVRDLLSQGRFRGRQAVLALPAAWMHIQHLRMPKMDEAGLKKALPWEIRGKMPVDPSQALLRHLVAGEVYQEQEPRHEVIAMAANRELVNQLLGAASRARLDVVGMTVEPQALVDCFEHLYRRKTDGEVTTCFVDIGCAGTRAVIARGAKILFARVVPVGGDQFTRAVAEELGVSFEEAKLLRIKACHLNPMLDEHRERQALAAGGEANMDQAFPLLGAGLSARRAGGQGGGTAVAETVAVAAAPGAGEVAAPEARGEAELHRQARVVEQACREPLDKLVEELGLCRRYYEATFPNRPVDRLVFVGGEARQRGLCQYVAQQMGLAAQVGDPMVRMGRVSEVGIESGIDRRQPQPSWAVAVGLSMGPVG